MESQKDRYFALGNENGVWFSTENILREYERTSDTSIDWMTPIDRNGVLEEGMHTEHFFESKVAPRLPSGDSTKQVCENIIREYQKTRNDYTNHIFTRAGEYKANANHQMTTGHFAEAISSYSQAIVSAVAAVPTENEALTVKQKLQFISMCMGNRSLSLLKCGIASFALQDALCSVILNPRYKKGWYRIYQAISHEDVTNEFHNFAEHLSLISRLIRWLDYDSKSTSNKREESVTPPDGLIVQNMMSELYQLFSTLARTDGNDLLYSGSCSLRRTTTKGRSLFASGCASRGDSLILEHASSVALMPCFTDRKGSSIAWSICANDLCPLKVGVEDSECYYAIPSYFYCIGTREPNLVVYFDFLEEHAAIQVHESSTQFCKFSDVNELSASTVLLFATHTMRQMLHPEVELAVSALISDQMTARYRNNSSDEETESICLLEQLQNNVESLPVEQLIVYGVQATCAIYLLNKAVATFSHRTQCNIEMKPVTDAVLWKYMCIVSCNTHVLAKPMAASEQKRITWTRELLGISPGQESSSHIENVEHIQYALGLFKMANMINHSRRPNCMFSYHGRKIKVVAIHDVSMDDEITVAYTSTDDVDKLESVEENFAISRRSRHSKNTDAVAKLPEWNEYWKEHDRMLNCSERATADVHGLETQAAQLVSTLEKISSTGYSENRAILWKQVASIYDSLAQMLAENGDFGKAATYVEISIKYLYQVKHQLSPDMGNEWMKLCQLYFNAGDSSKCYKAAVMAEKCLLPFLSQDDPQLEELKHIKSQMSTLSK